MVKQAWTQFGRAEVDLFANRRNSHCALWFSLVGQSVLGGGHICTRAMAKKAASRLSTAAPYPPPLLSVILVAPGSRLAPW